MNLWQKFKLGLSILIGKTSTSILDEKVYKDSTLDPKMEVVSSKSILDESAADYQKRLLGAVLFMPDILKQQKVVVQPRTEHITLLPFQFPIKEIMIGEQLIPLLRDYTKTRIQQERTHFEVVVDEGNNNSLDWIDQEWVTERTLTDTQHSSTLTAGWVPELVTKLHFARDGKNDHPLGSYTPETFHKKSYANIDSFTKPFIEHLRPVLVDMCRITLLEKGTQNINILKLPCDTIDEVKTKIGRGCSSSFTLIDVPEIVIVDCISKMNQITYEELEKLRLQKYTD